MCVGGGKRHGGGVKRGEWRGGGGYVCTNISQYVRMNIPRMSRSVPDCWGLEGIWGGLKCGGKGREGSVGRGGGLM